VSARAPSRAPSASGKATARARRRRAAPDAASRRRPGHNAEFGTTERDDWENGTERDDFDGIRETPSLAASGSGAGGDDDFEPQTAAPMAQLQDHLRAPAAGMRCRPRMGRGDGADRVAQRGRLPGRPAGRDRRALDRYEADEDGPRGTAGPAALRAAWLQSLEPTGVGARNLGECLLLQLRATPRSEARQVAMASAAATWNCWPGAT
jgi:RNA polymerase sigma-54 factor